MAGARGTAAAAGHLEAAGEGSAASALQTMGDHAALADRRAAWTRRTGCERLSDKERKVLAELAHGNSTEEIGRLLSVSPHTVRTHVKNMMRKLGARTRAHAVAIAMAENAIDY
jgi:DNA-binding CsgD family transcriptional regulator